MFNLAAARAAVDSDDKIAVARSFAVTAPAGVAQPVRSIGIARVELSVVEFHENELKRVEKEAGPGIDRTHGVAGPRDDRDRRRNVFPVRFAANIVAASLEDRLDHSDFLVAARVDVADSGAYEHSAFPCHFAEPVPLVAVRLGAIGQALARLC